MVHATLSPLAPVGRVLLCLIFFLAAVADKIPNFPDVVGRMRDAGVPIAPVALVGAIVFLIAGSISVVLGVKARLGALLLLVFLILAAYYFHDFWNLEGEERANQMQHFMKNLTIGGAMIFIIGNGPGPWSIDPFLKKRREKGAK